MNGLKVLSKLRQDERTKDIIVVMLTAKNMMEDVETVLATVPMTIYQSPSKELSWGQES